MPSLAYGEEAVCDSNFSSHTTVGGLSEKIDSTHAAVTITTVKMILQLSVNIWVPAGVTQHVVEHENGHRQISEYYYQAADKLADRVASPYIGTKINITGSDLNAEFEKALSQVANDITAEYDKNINLAATQQYYDAITDHGRSESDTKQAVVAAVANTKTSSIQPPIEAEK
jgi:phage gpG-like protein